MEVLAPAGSIDALKAALLAGADAIYLGGKRFSARKFAQNFSFEELIGAIELAHSRRAKVYITVNTLIKESELDDAISYVGELKDIGADAIIVQDLGLASLVLDRIRIPVHASTQMGIHTPEGAAWAEKKGIKRVILARELGLNEISKIKKSTNIGLEVFIHGALCYCFSGQCLFSSFAGGRSGNRGMCAQPCRKEYRLGKEQGYLLSMPDLFCAEIIPQLLSIGVSAIKIEGRMRSPIYVYLTTKIYKAAVARALKGIAPLVTEKEKKLLTIAFNRGFSQGYYTESQMKSTLYPDSRGLFLADVEVKGGFVCPYPIGLSEGDGVTLYRGDEKIGGFKVTKEHVANRLLSIQFPVKDGFYELYKTRDNEFNMIENKISSLNFSPKKQKMKRRKEIFNFAFRERKPCKPKISALVSSLKTAEAVLPFVDRIYFDFSKKMAEIEDFCKSHGIEFIPILPRVSPTIPEIKSSSIMVCSIDQAHKYQKNRLYGYYSMNVFNHCSTEGFYQTMASVELSREELKEILVRTCNRIEVLAFGRVELMVSKDPNLGTGNLRDLTGKTFPTYRDTLGYVHILNCADLLLLDFLDELGEMGVDSLALDLRRRASNLASLVAKSFYYNEINKKNIIKRKCGAITTGHYLKKVD